MEMMIARPIPLPLVWSGLLVPGWRRKAVGAATFSPRTTAARCLAPYGHEDCILAGALLGRGESRTSRDQLSGEWRSGLRALGRRPIRVPVGVARHCAVVCPRSDKPASTAIGDRSLQL